LDLLIQQPLRFFLITAASCNRAFDHPAPSRLPCLHDYPSLRTKQYYRAGRPPYRISIDATITDPATTATPKTVPISGPATTFDVHAAVPDAGTHHGILHARMDPSAATENDAREPAGVLTVRTTQIRQCKNGGKLPWPGAAVCFGGGQYKDGSILSSPRCRFEVAKSPRLRLDHHQEGGLEKGGGYSLDGVASRSAARSGGIGIDRTDSSFGRRRRLLVWGWAGVSLLRVGARL